MVAGENRKFPVLLLQPQFDFLQNWCKRKDIAWTTPEEMVQHPRVMARIQKEVDTKNAQFGKWEAVKKIVITADAWTIPAGHLTPTMKLRRKPILKMYEAAYEGLYAE